MCGFCGFLQFDRVIEPDAMGVTVEHMSDALRHRGPDDAGSWVDALAGIALGHRRLSIIDLSVEGHQPMTSASGRYVIAYNGEVYNFPALRRQLDRNGVRWRGHSDTEVLLAAIEAWGLEGALKRLNGMFAFALWDREVRTLHLARDRLGEKPLYYGWIGKTFLFGSELKSLRKHPAWQGEIDRNSLALYLRHNYVPSPYSIYIGIAKLPAAHRLEVQRMGPARPPTPQPYWSLRDAAEHGVARPLAGDAESVVAELDVLLRDAVKKRTIADVPVGVFLSGGVDSSTVAALMQAQSSQPVRTFSIGFNEKHYNEAHYAKAVAKHLGTDHTELYVTPAEALAVIPTLADVYDEPFADSSQIPTILVSRLARRHVTVVLSGDGGDELFCGYGRYFLARSIWSKIGRIPRRGRNAVAAALNAVSADAWKTLFGTMGRFVPAIGAHKLTADRVHKFAEVLALRSPDALYHGLISHWKNPAALVLRSEERPTILTDRNQWPVLADFMMRMMYLDAVTYLPDDILVKVDRASMSVGLEARVPLLDHDIVEYAWRIPLSLKIRGGQGKWVLRQVLYRYVPRVLIERPKMGFGVPIDSWLRGPLRGWAEELLADHRLRADGYFDPAPIRHKWAEHLSGQHNWQYYLWDVLMFQTWLDRQRVSIGEKAIV